MLFNLLSLGISDTFIYKQNVDDAIKLLNFLFEQKAQQHKEKMQSLATIVMLPHIKEEDRKKAMKVIFAEEKKPLSPQQEREALLKLKNMLQ